MTPAAASSVAANVACIFGAPPTVFVVNADQSVRERLQTLIPYAGCAVETFATATAFLNSRRPDSPSCLILDLDLPDIHGLDLQKRVAEDSKVMSVVFTTSRSDVYSAVQAMKAAAVEFLTAPLIDGDLLSAISEALSRSRAGLAAQAEIQVLRHRYGNLTRREREVMDLVVQGASNKRVAAKLGISDVTVKVHRGRAMQKMQAKSLPGLVIMAARLSRDDRTGAPSTSSRTPAKDAAGGHHDNVILKRHIKPPANRSLPAGRGGIPFGLRAQPTADDHRM